jgi:coenzyme F420 hydrogenase subunit beta
MKATHRLNKVIEAGICTGCGACVAADASQTSQMILTDNGPIPSFTDETSLPDYIDKVCSGLGANYPELYKQQFGKLPENWLTGHIEEVYTGYSAIPEVRGKGASGGVITQTLIYLLETGKIDAVILAKQGIDKAENAGYFIAKTKEKIIECAQSVYIPVSMLDALKEIEKDKQYAMICLPEQSAALRVLQHNSFQPALQIKYETVPIRCFLSSKGIKKDDEITSLKWRAGEWPGYLEIKTTSGEIVKTPKVYYNFLIPFFVTQTSLQSMDFANEFADLAVGDAWSPVFESEGAGHSIVVTRTKDINDIINQMQSKDLLNLTHVEELKASDMHGHMIDFKKRGGWLRNQWRRKTGRMAPDYGYQPANIPLSRIMVEIVISTLFAIGKTKCARYVVSKVPESIIGPIFNKLRLGWKKASRPTKRKGLANFDVKIRN